MLAETYSPRWGRRSRQPATRSWPNELVLTSHFRLFHVAYDGLPTVIDVDVLDANVLLPTVTKPSIKWPTAAILDKAVRPGTAVLLRLGRRLANKLSCLSSVLEPAWRRRMAGRTNLAG